MYPSLCAVSLVFLIVLPPNDASLDIVSDANQNCVFESGQLGMKCWGWNPYGQSGYGDTNNRGDNPGEMGVNLPIVNLGPDFRISMTSLGGYHSCATSQENALKCWGYGGEYQLGFANPKNLGDGAGEMGANLAFVQFDQTFLPFKVAAGEEHSCVLSTDLRLVCFGHNLYGQCGAGRNDEFVVGPPSDIAAVNLGSNFTPIHISAFLYHVCAISQQQTIKCFGLNANGQLGYGDTTDRGRTPQSMGNGLPVINLGQNFTPKAIDVGYRHTCVLSTAKTIKCFGLNSYGECGQEFGGEHIGDAVNEMGENLLPIVFDAGFVPMQIALGGYHTCVLSESALVVCFGHNGYGQLGLGHTDSTLGMNFNLRPVDLGSNFVPRKIAAGEWHTCAISTIDTIKCWGWNGDGELGIGNTEDMGDEPNEMGDNLPIVDVAFPTTQPTAAPNSQSPTAAPTTQPATQTPTTAPTTQTPTAAPTTQPATQTPTTAPTTQPATQTPTTTAPNSPAPTTAAPTTASPTSATPTTTSPSKPSPTTAVPTQQPSAMNATTRAVTSHTTQATQPPQAHAEEPNSLLWVWYIVLCIVSVCLCFTLFGFFKCLTAKRHHQRNNEEQPVQAERQVAMSDLSLPVVPNVRVYVLDSDSEIEEKKEDIQPGAGEADFGHDDSIVDDNRAEGLRASVVAQALAAVLNGLHRNPTSDGLAEDEFEVVDKNEAATNKTCGE